MSSRLRSIITEIDAAARNKLEPVTEIEILGRHAFAATERLVEMIGKNYSEEETEMMIKRFYLAVKAGDYRRFVKALKKMDRGIKSSQMDDQPDEE